MGPWPPSASSWPTTTSSYGHGVRALLEHEPDLEVIGEASDHAGLMTGAQAAAPQVVVTDIRMPPTFQREGLDAARELRQRLPGLGVVVLSQFDDPDYAARSWPEGPPATGIYSRTGWRRATNWPTPCGP